VLVRITGITTVSGALYSSDFLRYFQTENFLKILKKIEIPAENPGKIAPIPTIIGMAYLNVIINNSDEFFFFIDIILPHRKM
jgi:hypothetical protein